MSTNGAAPQDQATPPAPPPQPAAEPPPDVPFRKMVEQNCRHSAMLDEAAKIFSGAVERSLSLRAELAVLQMRLDEVSASADSLRSQMKETETQRSLANDVVLEVVRQALRGVADIGPDAKEKAAVAIMSELAREGMITSLVVKPRKGRR